MRFVLIVLSLSLVTACTAPADTAKPTNVTATNAAPRFHSTGSRISTDRPVDSPDVKTLDASAAKGVLGSVGAGAGGPSAVVP